MKLTPAIRKNITALARSVVGRYRVQVEFIERWMRNADGSTYKGHNIALAHEDVDQRDCYAISSFKKDIEPSRDGSVVIDIYVGVWNGYEFNLDGGHCFNIRIDKDGSVTGLNGMRDIAALRALNFPAPETVTFTPKAERVLCENTLSLNSEVKP